MERMGNRESQIAFKQLGTGTGKPKHCSSSFGWERGKKIILEIQDQKGTFEKLKKYSEISKNKAMDISPEKLKSLTY